MSQELRNQMPFPGEGGQIKLTSCKSKEKPQAPKDRITGKIQLLELSFRKQDRTSLAKLMDEVKSEFLLQGIEEHRKGSGAGKRLAIQAQRVRSWPLTSTTHHPSQPQLTDFVLEPTQGNRPVNINTCFCFSFIFTTCLSYKNNALYVLCLFFLT